MLADEAGSEATQLQSESTARYRRAAVFLARSASSFASRRNSLRRPVPRRQTRPIFRAVSWLSNGTGERVAVLTASARSLPPLTYSIEDMVADMTCTCPPSRSISAGPAPRYGTSTRLTPVIILNSSPAIWVCGTDAGRRHVDLAGIGCGMGDELGNRLDRHGWIHLHDKELVMMSRSDSSAAFSFSNCSTGR